MRVCIWTSSVFKLGGTKRVVTMIANEMAKEHEVVVATFDRPEDENREMYGLSPEVAVDFIDSSQYKDAKTKRGGLMRAFRRHFNERNRYLDRPRSIEKVRDAYYPDHVIDAYAAYFNAKDYDVIVATAGLALVLAVMSDKVKAKTVGWAHNCYDAYFSTKGQMFYTRREMAKAYLAKLDAFLVLNPYDKVDYDKNLGIDCRLAPNPRSFVSEQKTDITQKNFFVAVRFVRQKGMDLLIDAFEKFCTVNPDWNLIVAGDGPQRRKILDMVWKKKLQNRIRFIGTTDNVLKYYLESSVYLLSSRWEGWGLVIIEAFETGMPVISFDITPVDTLITNGVDGLIVPCFDTTMFAAAMAKLARDEELRASMAEKAIEKAKVYAVENVYRNWHDLLETLVK